MKKLLVDRRFTPGGEGFSKLGSTLKVSKAGERRLQLDACIPGRAYLVNEPSIQN